MAKNLFVYAKSSSETAGKSKAGVCMVRSINRDEAIEYVIVSVL
jgi:hypothetical protein